MDEEKHALTLLIQGNLDGLEPLVRAHYFEAVRSAYLIIGDRSQAEEIVQSEFLSLESKLHTFNMDRSFRPWFMRCVVNSTLNKLKRDKRLISLDAAEETGTLEKLLMHTRDDFNPEDDIEAIELRQRVWDALRKLSPDQRAAIVMRYYLDLNQAEMVESMDAPASSVKWWLHSARKRLRDLLKSREPGPNQIFEQDQSEPIQKIDQEQSYG